MCNEYTTKECMNKTLSLKNLYPRLWHPSFWINSSLFHVLWTLSICHVRIDGAIIKLFSLTFRITGWQSWEGPQRQSPMPLMKSELLRRKPEADVSKLPLILSPNKQHEQMHRILYTFPAVFLSVRISCTVHVKGFIYHQALSYILFHWIITISFKAAIWHLQFSKAEWLALSWQMSDGLQGADGI